MDKKDIVIPKEMTNFYNNFHFAPAVKDRDRLYCSGVIGLGSDNAAVIDDQSFDPSIFADLYTTRLGVSPQRQ